MINIPPELLTNARMHYTYLHEHPELSFAEEQTAAYIRRTLDCLQIQYTNAGPTGIIGFLPGRDTSRTNCLTGRLRRPADLRKGRSSSYFP